MRVLEVDEGVEERLQRLDVGSEILLGKVRGANWSIQNSSASTLLLSYLWRVKLCKDKVMSLWW